MRLSWAEQGGEPEGALHGAARRRLPGSACPRPGSRPARPRPPALRVERQGPRPLQLDAQDGRPEQQRPRQAERARPATAPPAGTIGRCGCHDNGRINSPSSKRGSGPAQHRQHTVVVDVVVEEHLAKRRIITDLMEISEKDRGLRTETTFAWPCCGHGSALPSLSLYCPFGCLHAGA